MILKSFEIEKIDIKKYNYYLFYGENPGFKKEIIEKKFQPEFKNNTFSNPAELIKYINDKKNYISIRPDQRIFVKFNEQKENLIDYIKSIVNDFLKMIEN